MQFTSHLDGREVNLAKLPQWTFPDEPVRLVSLFLLLYANFKQSLGDHGNFVKLIHSQDVREALERVPDAPAMLQMIKDLEKS